MTEKITHIKLLNAMNKKTLIGATTRIEGRELLMCEPWAGQPEFDTTPTGSSIFSTELIIKPKTQGQDAEAQFYAEYIETLHGGLNLGKDGTTQLDNAVEGVTQRDFTYKVLVNLTDYTITYQKYTIAQSDIYVYTISTDLIGVEEQGLIVQLTFVDEKKLHGLSYFYKKHLTTRQLKPLMALVMNGSFGMLPQVVQYNSGRASLRVVPSLIEDTFVLSTDNILTAMDGFNHMAVDISGADVQVKLGSISGYTLEATINKTESVTIYVS